MSDEKRKPYHEEFAEQVIQSLKEGTAPWQKPWEKQKAGFNLLPQNPVSGTVYRGANRVWLAMRDTSDDPRWMTYKQAQEIGAQVKKGEKGASIAFWQWTKEVPQKDEHGKPILDDDGKVIKRTVNLERPMVRYSTVFHASQIDGLKPFELQQESVSWNPHDRAEGILSGSGAKIIHDQEDRAFYRPSSDEIHLPLKSQFPDAGRYYATALHELGHWTGHASRLDRDIGHFFGSPDYAKEELRAEIASWMLGTEIGLGHDPKDHAAYVQSWIKTLQEDPYEIIRACRDAEHIKDYVLAREIAVEKNLEQEQPAPTREIEQDSPVLAAELDAAPAPAPQKTYLDVPYAEKNLAKAAGARWDAGAKLWYAPQNADLNNLQAWMPGERVTELFADLMSNVEQDAGAQWDDNARMWITADGQAWMPGREKEESQMSVPEVTKPPILAAEKTFLHVPYEEKDLAKAAGARWDKAAKLWFAPEGADLEKLRLWMPDKELTPAPAHDSHKDFAQALADMGLDLDGKQPVMDGKIHRAPLLDGKPGNLDGAYCGYLDGRPAGWVQNFKTGERNNWTSGHTLDAAARTGQRLEMLERQEQRDADRSAEYDRVAAQCQDIWNARSTAPDDHAYLQAKGVPSFGLKLSQGGELLVPLRNIDGEIRGLQAITADGNKQFMPGSQKKGSFHLLSGDKDLNKEEIILAEGYATGASLHMATQKPVAVAFDAGNLEVVAKKLREKYPEARITIAADNDHKRQNNIGVEKAKKAAQEVGGTVRIPIFTAEEKGKGLTDFNDLHQSRGLSEVKKQVGLSMSQSQDKGLSR